MSDLTMSDLASSEEAMAGAADGPAIIVPRAPVRKSLERNHADIDSLSTWAAARVSLAAARWRSRRAMRDGLAASRTMAGLAALSHDELERRGALVRSALRARGMTTGNIVEGLAIAGEVGRRVLGLSPFTGQLACAGAMLNGAVAEMETGEGKTLAAFLAAAVFGLAGRAVHVVTSNDYLAARDAQTLEPAYRALGLTIGTVVGGDPVPSRRAAYACDIVYLSSKEVVFDYLRDRLARSKNPFDPGLSAKLGRVFGPGKTGGMEPLQRALDVAIVDEIDSVLIDEAATPLLISANQAGDISEDIARQALDYVERLKPGLDFIVDPLDIMPHLTPRGLLRLEAETSGFSGPWRVRLIREELVRAAIASVHVLKRDHHYLVRDGKIALIDQQSGRVTPDRHWSHGLSLMVEVKEGCSSTGEKKSLASISFQRFFRGYGRLCGMSGTVREVSAELYSVYGLPAAWIRRRLPLRRRHAKRAVFPDRKALWDAAARVTKILQERGQPALIAVRSVGEANRASEALTALGVAHRVLSAAHDQAEAETVANAGERGVITVVTNMAGRGTDIRLGAGVAELGGLAVVICERHDSRRVDRQLIGRCARQGDPGLVMEFVSRDDGVLAALEPRWHALIDYWPPLTGFAIARAQRAADMRAMRARLQLLRRDEQLSKLMAFAGGLD